jgi:L-rhamnose mutarotase
MRGSIDEDDRMSPHRLDPDRASPDRRNRYCFLLQVRPELLAEYAQRHAAVWPDMLRALRDTGWTNYSIFARDDGLLVGYAEAESLEKAQAAMAGTEVNARWQADMARFFVGLEGRPPDEGLLLLKPVFQLENQLAAIGEGT